MNKALFLRSAAIAVAVGAAFSAHAVGILLDSAGTTANVGPNIVVTENVLAQVGGYGPLASVVYTFSNNAAATGSGVYTGAGGTLDFDITFSLNSLQNSGNAQSLSGVWTATGGTGTYLNAVGEGTVAWTVQNAIGQPSGTVLAGDITAVPEPSSMVLLGLGGLGLVVLRKRA